MYIMLFEDFVNYQNQNMNENNYIENANNFAANVGLTMEIVGEPRKERYFSDDEQDRWIYTIKLIRNKKSFVFEFAQSFDEGKKPPTMYVVLSSLIKYEVGDYEDFLSEYDYEDSKQAKALYKTAVKEYKNVEKLFGDVMDELREID